jgi:pimeloyl-ACP methyl ester carboxylesterase
MRIIVDGNETYVGTGGRAFDPALPAVVFLHGAGLDHSVWALLARAFAHHGCGVLAPDLPGHGRSAGTPLVSIAALADWTAALIAAAGVSKARLVGHSMGSLIALETAARHPDKVSGLGLIATAAAMAVSADLLNAAKANDHAAIDMVAIWGNGYHATIGGSLAPGLWMLGGAERLLERARPGVLFADLAACNEYRDALAAAAKVTVPAAVILGGRCDDASQERQGRRRRHAGRTRHGARRRRPHADDRAPRGGACRAARVRLAQRPERTNRPILGTMTPALLALTAI